MSTLLASRLKQRRKELKLSQKELADGICKQGQISRLENGEYTPGSDLLHELAKRLKVSMDYFFDEENNSIRNSELLDFKNLSKKFILYRNYESLRYIYELENAKKHQLSLSDKMYMEWIHSLIQFYYYEKKDKAIDQLEETLSQFKKTDINYLRLANTLSNYYYEVNELEKFEVINKDLILKVSSIQIVTVEELELVLKIKYNFCRHLWLKKDIESAIKETTETIEQCKKYSSTYHLADLYCLLGNISESLSNKKLTKEYFETAKFLYDLDNNQQMVLNIEHYIMDNY